jgi:hypothetical protein
VEHFLKWRNSLLESYGFIQKRSFRTARFLVICGVEKEIRIFHSFAESERADREFYRSLTGSQRVDILLDLVNQWDGDEAAKGFERVYRIVKLNEG